MKQLSILSIGVAALAMIFSSCEKDPITGTIVLPDNETQSVAVGKTLSLQSVSPSDYSGSLAWFSEKEEVCTVNNEGVVTGVSVGESKVFATNGTSVLASYTVTVYNEKKYFKYNDAIYPLEYACTFVDDEDGYIRMAFSQEIFDYAGPSERNLPAAYLMISMGIEPSDNIDLTTTAGINFGFDIKEGIYDWYSSNSSVLNKGTLSFKENSSSTPENPAATVVLKITTEKGDVFEIHYSGTFKQNDYWNWW